MTHSPFPPSRPTHSSRDFLPTARRTTAERRVFSEILHAPSPLLRPYQRDGVLWLRANPHALLAYEMRVGKTPTSLSALPQGGRTIVICPATIKLQWRDAIEGVPGDALRHGGAWATVGWRKDLRARIAEAGDSLVPDYGEVVITNLEALPDPVAKNRLVDENLRDVRVIIDEAHGIKNPFAIRTQKVRALVRQCQSAWPMTGSPMMGTPMDLWGMLEACMLHKQAFGTFANFLDIFGGRRSKKHYGPEWEFHTHDYEPGKAALAKVMLRKRRSDPDVAAYLPPKVYAEIPVEITTSVIIENAEQKWQLLGADKLPPFELLAEAMTELARLKIPAMLDVVEQYEAEELPLLVFSRFLAPLRALEGRPGWAVIDGEDQNMQRRHDIVAAFQAGELKGVGVGIRAGGTGLALHRAADELFVSLDYSPSANEQAEDRAVSLSQPDKVLNVNLLIADHPLDRRLFEILRDKEDLIEGVVG